MKLTKDEARILSYFLYEYKYEFNDKRGRDIKLFKKLGDLEFKLKEYSKDKRRTGRTSLNDFSDTLKRFVNKSPKKV